MYKVIHYFTDLQDFNHPYDVGDTFPRQGVSVTEERLKELGFKRVDEGEYFNEFLTTSPIDPKVLEEKLSDKKILSGLEVEDKILWCATELNTKEKIDVLADAIKEVL